MWTVYKNFNPDLENQTGWADYYQLRLLPNHESSQPRYVVEEYHGWFNDETKRNEHHTQILAPEDSFHTWQQAMSLVQQQLLYLAESGYVHQLTFDPFAPRHFQHKVLDPAELRKTND